MAQEKWLVDEPKVIDTGIVRALRVGLAGGQVDVVAHDEPTARIEVHGVSGKQLKIELDGDTLTIDHPQIGWEDPLGFLKSFRGRDSADVSVLVPRDARVTIGVVSAGALLSGTNRGASVNTVSGDVVVDGLAGDLAVHAVSGTTTVRGLDGALTVRTVSGNVVATGAIPRLTADGVNADVLLDLQGTPDSARVNTVSGSVDVRLEDGVAYRATVSTATGTLQFDDAQLRGVRGSHVQQSGELSGQWLDLRVNSVSGGVAVVHAPPVTDAWAGTPSTEPTTGTDDQPTEAPA
ncbi:MULTISPECIES: DUF4097 family beta strand repeat-containing protein [unclassified Curtobacterium]|uniref:DUF4097 family beta strand repeat-containing protein n=1 Tax=unclassified Curtobacterium TaxID=257496 RepID=UPI0008250BE2|nr:MULTISPECIES: DUF4097 family beta strand repeat-containing protein [unclassified Curtobacterium]WIA97459.1 DUF4097 family beta strand repeat-containing protein [Curtobacterium sp. MCBA15_004]WIB00780.1 DUF4097 family beta strand repeat-containing protein [Curtobacterium sp. MCBA15_012]